MLDDPEDMLGRLPEEARPLVQRHRPRRAAPRRTRSHRAEAAAARLPERRSARPARRRRCPGRAALVHHRGSRPSTPRRTSRSPIRPRAFRSTAIAPSSCARAAASRLAHQFLDYLLRPAVSAQIVEATKTATANGAALRPSARGGPQSPQRSTRRRDVFERGEWPRTLPPSAQRLRDRIWTEIKSA